MGPPGKILVQFKENLLAITPNHKLVTSGDKSFFPLKEFE